MVWSVAILVNSFSTTYAKPMTACVFVDVGEASYATVAPTIIGDVYAELPGMLALTCYFTAVHIGG